MTAPQAASFTSSLHMGSIWASLCRVLFKIDTTSRLEYIYVLCNVLGPQGAEGRFPRMGEALNIDARDVLMGVDVESYLFALYITGNVD